MPAFDSTSTLRGLWLFDLDRGRTVRSEMHNSASVKSKGTKVGNDTMPGMDMQVKSSVLTELVGPEDSIDPQSEGMKGK